MFRLLIVLSLAIYAHSALADATSVGPAGIDAMGLLRADGVTLTGNGVNIGQVERRRVAVRGFDSDANSNAFVIPFESRIRNGMLPSPNDEVLDHTLEVASVMIGAPGAPTSVSPNASLYSSAFVSTFQEEDVLVTTQYIAKRFTFSDTRHIRAINHSYGLPPEPETPNDGNSLLTLGVDWMASEFDVLNIFSGNQDQDLNIRPTDNYNGITVAMSEQFLGDYSVVSDQNDTDDFFDAEGDRVSIDLLAPGVGITVATAGAANPSVTRTGTSYAAPHVTGTVALLNEYADDQVLNSGSFRWDVDNTRKHEVMKAVLLNSADKLDGIHGANRTVIDQNGLTWEQSEAFTDDTISLDQQMGAGHLNARRALRQFSSGEYNNGEVIPSIGWDYDETAGFPTDRVYSIGQFGGGYVAVTLAWDRGVTKIGGLDNSYDPTNFFTGDIVDDLDLFIVPIGWVDPLADAVAMSITTEDNVEHIFKEIPAGEYELLVRQFSGGDRDYGLAWWLGTDAGVPIDGDFDDDGDVDADDLGEWEMNFGPGDGADADGDGDSDGNDFLVWQRNLGTGVPAAPAGAAIPEPASVAMLGVGAVGLSLARRRA